MLIRFEWCVNPIVTPITLRTTPIVSPKLTPIGTKTTPVVPPHGTLTTSMITTRAPPIAYCAAPSAINRLSDSMCIQNIVQLLESI